MGGGGGVAGVGLVIYGVLLYEYLLRWLLMRVQQRLSLNDVKRQEQATGVNMKCINIIRVWVNGVLA